MRARRHARSREALAEKKKLGRAGAPQRAPGARLCRHPARRAAVPCAPLVSFPGASDLNSNLPNPARAASARARPPGRGAMGAGAQTLLVQLRRSVIGTRESHRRIVRSIGLRWTGGASRAERSHEIFGARACACLRAARRRRTALTCACASADTKEVQADPPMLGQLAKIAHMVRILDPPTAPPAALPPVRVTHGATPSRR